MAATKNCRKENWNPLLFQKLCEIFCTQEEVCYILGMSINTLNKYCKKEFGKSFWDAKKGFKAYGKSRLRETLWEMAKTKPAVAIFISKNELGYSDSGYIDPDIEAEKQQEPEQEPIAVLAIQDTNDPQEN